MLGLRHQNANNTPRDIIGDFDSSCQGQISRRSLEGRLRRQPVETSPDLKRTSGLLKDDLNFEGRLNCFFSFFLLSNENGNSKLYCRFIRNKA